jgi:hypothetical protein
VGREEIGTNVTLKGASVRFADCCRAAPVPNPIIVKAIWRATVNRQSTA